MELKEYSDRDLVKELMRRDPSLNNSTEWIKKEAFNIGYEQAKKDEKIAFWNVSKAFLFIALLSIIISFIIKNIFGYR